MRQVELIGQLKVVLGMADINDERIIITTKEALRFNVNKTPFKSFFIERVLDHMIMVDNERVEDGELTRDEVINYTIALNGRDDIEKIIIESYGGERRERELIAAIRWTLDKMLIVDL